LTGLGDALRHLEVLPSLLYAERELRLDGDAALSFGADTGDVPGTTSGLTKTLLLIVLVWVLVPLFVNSVFLSF
jgi:hypothetical protein